MVPQNLGSESDGCPQPESTPPLWTFDLHFSLPEPWFWHWQPNFRKETVTEQIKVSPIINRKAGINEYLWGLLISQSAHGLPGSASTHNSSQVFSICTSLYSQLHQLLGFPSPASDSYTTLPFQPWTLLVFSLGLLCSLSFLLLWLWS